jgi:predicted nucleic acid-binding protein/predicted GNAT family acetyltransferase
MVQKPLFNNKAVVGLHKLVKLLKLVGYWLLFFEVFMSVVIVDEKSPYLESVKVLWRANSATLGYFTNGAFVDHANQGHILGVIGSSGECVGYLLYRTSKGKATIAHLCISGCARGKGYARELVNHLGLRCRRDFPIYNVWPKFGFAVVNEMPGRAADGSELTYFWLNHNHPDLFSQETTDILDTVIDANVFVDLVESRNEESQGLLADWLQDSIRLCVTPEHYNEFDRNSDADLRQKRRQEATTFHILDSSPAEFQKAEQLLTPLFSNLSTPQDESDFRHLARALSGGAWAFVTRDELLLDRADGVYKACGLSIVRPAELIGRIDELLREREYQRFQVAGTNRIFRQRESSADDTLVNTIKANDETKRYLRAILNPIFADPKRFSCFTIKDNTEKVLAFYVLERKQQYDHVPMFRICSNRLVGTLSRSILTALANNAAHNGQTGLLITESRLNDDLKTACVDLGFLPVQSGQLKIVVSGIHPANILADRLDQLSIKAPMIDRLSSVLRSPLDASIASQIEHLLWPAKIADSDILSFIVPIRPEYALHLFDENLAKQTLFGADIELALNPESVYYRSAYQRIPKFPGRILWYVSKGNFPGTMTIRACSRIVEVSIGKPKPLFKRFQRLGVYEWSDILRTAKKNQEQDIMAVRFDDTELLNPVAWDTFQSILKRHEIRTQLESPRQIPSAVFNEIYALALNSSALC